MSQVSEVLTEADFEAVHESIKAAEHYRYSVAGTPDKGMPCFQRLFEGKDNVWLRIYECVVLLDFSYSTNLRRGGKKSLFNMVESIKAKFDTLRLLKEAEEQGRRWSEDGDELAELINTLASTTQDDKGKMRNNISFATKLCAQIAPTQCPIYDSIVAERLSLWNQKKDLSKRGGKTTIKRWLYTKGEEGYKNYLELYGKFQDEHAQSLTFRKIDWILWWTGDKGHKECLDTDEGKTRFEELCKRVERICPMPKQES